MLSLVIPFSAPASMAKAKMCCKNKCSHMLRSAAQSQPKPINHCDHKKSPVNCCQENCSKIIGNDISDRLSGLSTLEYRALVNRAQSGDAAALPHLREYLDRQPQLWKTWGDLAAIAQREWLDKIFEDQLLLRSAVKRELGELRTQLCGPDPSSLERLLVERILSCWLQVNYLDARSAQMVSELTLAQSEQFQRLVDRAHRRFLAAIKSLAQVRRLLGPTVQVNIAEKQINLA